MPAIGDKISLDTLRARWSYCELRSPRQEQNYRLNARQGDESLFRKSKESVAFESLDLCEIARLVEMHHAVRGKLAGDYGLRRLQTFICEGLSKADLDRLLTLADFDPERRSRMLTFDNFVRAKRWREADGSPALYDPRLVCDSISDVNVSEPVIVVPTAQARVLLEGYLRSLFFRRSAGQEERLLAWTAVT